MNPLSTVKLLYGAVIIAILAGIYFFGVYNTTKSDDKKYLPQIATLQSVLEQGDKQAKELTDQYKENEDVLKKDNAKRFAATNAYYDRMLRDLQTKSANSPFATSSQGTDGAIGQQGVGRQSEAAIEFERRCILDSDKVTGWQEYAIRNHLPIGE